MLTADVVEPMTARQAALEAETETRQAESLAALIDRLTARLGEDRVLTPAAADSWIPERAERLAPALGRPVVADPGGMGRRPILLLDPPEPIRDPLFDLPDGAPARFTWRRAPRRITRAEGPERLSPEWWRAARARTRDYYCLEDADGARYWVFREGLYGREYAGGPDERAPTWWMHGVLACPAGTAPTPSSAR